MPAQRIMPPLTVVVAHYEDQPRLDRCLEALTQQDYTGHFDIVVADNGSRDVPIALIAKYARTRLTVEERRGSYAARNAALHTCTSEVIAFTDSDCVPMPDWLSRGVEALVAPPPCGLVAGAVDVFVKDPQSPTPVELYERVAAFPQKSYIDNDHFGVTANLFAYRTVFDQVGLFDERLESGGDREWGQRVFRAGFSQRYCAAARVRHPARRSLKELRQKLDRVLRGLERMERRERRSLAAQLRRFIPPVAYVARFLGDESLGPLRRRCGAAGVMLYMRYVTAWKMLHRCL